jgi:hypothetical protein
MCSWVNTTAFKLRCSDRKICCLKSGPQSIRTEVEPVEITTDERSLESFGLGELQTGQWHPIIGTP